MLDLHSTVQVVSRLHATVLGKSSVPIDILCLNVATVKEKVK